MSKRHQYQRWYYYPNFKRSLDGHYNAGGIGAIFAGVCAWISFQSFWTGLGTTMVAFFYHGCFIAWIEPRLARFWGEDKGCLAITLMVLVQWGLFFLILLILCLWGASVQSSEAQGGSTQQQKLSPRLIELLKVGEQQTDAELYAPLHGRCHTSLEDIAKFNDGLVDHRRIESLLRGLMLVNWPSVKPEHRQELLGPHALASPHAKHLSSHLRHLR